MQQMIRTEVEILTSVDSDDWCHLHPEVQNIQERNSTASLYFDGKLDERP
jgi:hypothetical protein